MRLFLLSLCIALPCFAAEPLIHFDFSKAQNGIVPNQGTGDYKAKLEGTCKFKDSALIMEGVTTRVTVLNSENFDVSKGYTFMMLYKRENFKWNDKSNQSMDTFFAKKNVFALSMYNTNFYGNGVCNGKWCMSAMRNECFPNDDLEWHHLAMTIQYVPAQGNAKEYVQFSFYKDGIPCGSVKHENKHFDKNSSPIEIGYNSAMGFPWNLGGEIADVRIYEGAVSEAEIKSVYQEQKKIQPFFKNAADADAKPLIHFDFSKAQDGIVPNLGTGDYKAKLEGTCKFNGSALIMEGVTTRVTVLNSENFDISKGYTFMMLYKRQRFNWNDKSNQSMDTFFAKKNVFALSMYHTNFYGNGVCNGKMCMSAMQSGCFPEDDLEWHHVAATVQYSPAQGSAKEYVQFSFYKDGVPCGSIKHENKHFDKNSSPIEIGYNSAMGFPWNLGGEIADVRIYEGAVPESGVQKIYKEQKQKQSFLKETSAPAADVKKK